MQGSRGFQRSDASSSSDINNIWNQPVQLFRPQQNQIQQHIPLTMSDRDQLKQDYEGKLHKMMMSHQNEVNNLQSDLDSVKAHNVVYQSEIAELQEYSMKVSDQLRKNQEYIKEWLKPTIEKKRMLEREVKILKTQIADQQRQIYSLEQSISVGNNNSFGHGYAPNTQSMNIHPSQQMPHVRGNSQMYQQQYYQENNNNSGYMAAKGGAYNVHQYQQMNRGPMPTNFNSNAIETQPQMYNPQLSSRQSSASQATNHSMHQPYNPTYKPLQLQSNGISHYQNQNINYASTQVSASPTFSQDNNQQNNLFNEKMPRGLESFIEGIEDNFGLEMLREVKKDRIDYDIESTLQHNQTENSIAEQRKKDYANLSL